MDKCLVTPELVSAICDELDPKTSVSMALTCHEFAEPALDRVWRVVGSIEPLLACVPNDLFVLDPTTRLMELRRVVTPKDLARYRAYYAPRIRGLDIQHYNIKRLSIDTLEALRMATDAQDGALAPRSKSCAWVIYGYGEHDFSYHNPWKLAGINLLLHIFLWAGPSVDRLQIQADWTLTFAQISAIHSTSRRLPNLTQLVFKGEAFRWLGGHPDIVTFPWKNLRSFTTASVLPSAIPHLAMLRHLTSLTLTNLEALPFKNSATPDFAHVGCTPYEPFRSLECLTLMADRLPFITSFLNILPSTNVVKTLNCSTTPMPSTSEVQILFEVILTKLNPNKLRTFVLDGGGAEDEEESYYNHQPAPWGEDLDHLGFDGVVDINPLFVFTSLECVKINLKVPLQLTPWEVNRITEAWVNLKQLDLCETFMLPYIPAINHTHLLQIVSVCTELKELGLSFEGTRVLGTERGVGGPFKLEQLTVGNSPICSPTRVAGLLATNFEKLREVKFGFEQVDMRHECINYQRWESVGMLLHQGRDS